MTRTAMNLTASILMLGSIGLEAAEDREARCPDNHNVTLRQTITPDTPAITHKLIVTPEAAAAECTVLHFLSDERLLASHRRTGPGIWDPTTGRLERKLSTSTESRYPILEYVAPDGTMGAGGGHFRSNGWRMQFQVWDLSRDRQFCIDGPNMEGNAHHLYITRDKKTLWATCSKNAISGAFNQVRLKITGTDPSPIEIEYKGYTGQEGMPRYHCATESLLIYFLDTTLEARGTTLCVWDLETLPLGGPRTFTLNGHSPKSFWRFYTRHTPLKPFEIDGVVEDKETEPAFNAYACLADPKRSELYVLVPYSRKPLGDTQGLRLTVIDTKEALQGKRCFPLPLFAIEGISLHPKKPILFCLTSDNRLLAIDTVSGRIAREVHLKRRVCSPNPVEKNPAISPDGRLLAVGNADGTISIHELSE
ncbi:MAG: hypothetical protein ACYTG0_36405 [Planctomycetota bacterium]|jgi:WD40 repeat protein